MTHPTPPNSAADLPETGCNKHHLIHCSQCRHDNMVRDLLAENDRLKTQVASLAGVQPAPAAPDADGEAFRTAARLGLTLRFYGGCAQSGMPGTPSAYEVATDTDRAAAMRDAIQRAEAVIASGGEPQRLTPAQQPAPAAERAVQRMEGWTDSRYIAELENLVCSLRRDLLKLHQVREVLADCSAGQPCTTCNDKKACQRGCIRQQEFVSTEYHERQRGAATPPAQQPAPAREGSLSVVNQKTVDVIDKEACHAQMIANGAAQPATAQPDAVDAARYRWLREQGTTTYIMRHRRYEHCIQLLSEMGGEHADAAIDAARAQAPVQAGGAA